MVHHTMPTRIAPATNDSSSNQPMCVPLRRATRAAPMRACAAALALFAAACQTLPPPAPTPTPAPRTDAVYAPVPFDRLPGWSSDALDAAWPALLVGCRALLAKPATAATWRTPCDAAAAMPTPDAAAARAFLEAQFTAYAIRDGAGGDTGLVSGYYEPLLAGSRTRTDAYRVPLYGPPDDLLTVDLAELYPELAGKRVRGRLDGRRVVPYWPRAGIDARAADLADRAIAWVADPVEAFFLEIQGSGRLQLADGGVMRVGYADQNGHPFRSVARVLIDRGEMTPDTASMQAIKSWGQRNPDRLPALLEDNPSYVFFREVPPPAPGSLDARIDGPIGSLGVPLLAERTIAVDTRYVPLGTPVFLDTTRPLSNAPLQRLTLAQDTGGAIRGIGRADFFWGFGDAAGREAGRMRQQGRMWLLWPRDAPPPQARAS
jgi:membrane-bound lytic murein transglycosylase A